MKSFDEIYNELEFEKLDNKIKQEHEKIVYLIAGICLFMFFAFFMFNTRYC